MLSTCTVVFSFLISGTWGSEVLEFPRGFQFGVASSSYQIEGAWNTSDKSKSIWDQFTHKQPNFMPERDSGDVACDSYHQWERDVEMVKELGVDFYRFSISWPRILPKGFTNYVSKEGTKYYSDLIDGLLEKGIEPVVTIYHWDLPQILQNLGGWANPLISDWFSDYSRIVFSLYGDRVKTWITINEPMIMCDVPYQFGFLAPGIVSPDVGSRLCSKHVLLAHAKAWRVYDEEFRAKYHGRVSLTNFVMWFQPKTAEDAELAELAQQYFAGFYSSPIYAKEGGWPPGIEKLIAEYSKRLGYPQSSLPSLSKEETELIKGTYDFYALNYYTSRIIRKANDTEFSMPSTFGDLPQLQAKMEFDPTWNLTASAFYPKHPEGIRKQLNWLKKEYGDLTFVITENGFGSHGGLADKDRIEFFRDYLKQVLLAIKDGVNVTAFTAWSLMDSFEWMDGYRTKFGLYEVDFESPTRKRTPRASAFYYARVIKNISLDVSDEVIIVQEKKLQDNTPNYNYILIACGGLVIFLIAILICQVRRRRASVLTDSYIGVHTEETAIR